MDTIGVRAFEKHWIDFKERLIGVAAGKFCSIACCKGFSRLINDPESPVYYVPETRHFFLVRTPVGYQSKHSASRGFTIFNCPICGFKFEPNLNPTWHKTIEKKFKIEDFGDPKQFAKIDKKYLTEDWWLKQKHKFKKNNDSLLERFRKQMCDMFKGQKLHDLVAWEAEKAKNLDGACCTRLYEVMNDLGDCPIYPDKKCSDYPLEYFPERRLFRIINTPSSYLLHKMYCKEKLKYRKLFYDIFYCPMCGAKLPKSLTGEWFDQISKKFGVQSILNKREMAKVPEKYLTDEWWKELGL